MIGGSGLLAAEPGSQEFDPAVHFHLAELQEVCRRNSWRLMRTYPKFYGIYTPFNGGRLQLDYSQSQCVSACAQNGGVFWSQITDIWVEDVVEDGMLTLDEVALANEQARLVLGWLRAWPDKVVRMRWKLGPAWRKRFCTLHQSIGSRGWERKQDVFIS